MMRHFLIAFALATAPGVGIMLAGFILVPPRLVCRLGIHKWSIATWPIGVRWCFRCGRRWPA